MSDSQVDENWKINKKPPEMSRVFEFDTYEATRQFLDDLAELSESTGYYPNLNFTRTQVSVRIDTDEDVLGDKEFDFAAKTNELIA